VGSKSYQKVDEKFSLHAEESAQPPGEEVCVEDRSEVPGNVSLGSYFGNSIDFHDNDSSKQLQFHLR
jgi:hypothetical protein